MSIYFGIQQSKETEESKVVQTSYAKFFFCPTYNDVQLPFPSDLSVKIDGLKISTSSAARIYDNEIGIPKFGWFSAASENQSKILVDLKAKLPIALKAFADALAQRSDPPAFTDLNTGALITSTALPESVVKYWFVDPEFETRVRQVQTPKKLYFRCDAHIPQQGIIATSNDGKLRVKIKAGNGNGLDSDDAFFFGVYGEYQGRLFEKFTDQQIQEAMLNLGHLLLAQPPAPSPAFPEWVKAYKPVQSTVTTFQQE